MKYRTWSDGVTSKRLSIKIGGVRNLPLSFR